MDSDGDGAPYYLDDDSDGDGISDADEGTVDTDGDGVEAYLDDDSDGDGFTDAQEGGDDIDGDGLIDAQDTDSDGDGIDDADDPDPDGDDIIEPDTTTDTDGDGSPDFLDSDSDGDGIDDVIEGDEDVDGDGIEDYLDQDTDGDGVPDMGESFDDIDGDGVPSFEDDDSDGDGIPDAEDDDFDGDGIPDDDEGWGDADGDGIPDALDQDSDNDGIPDSEDPDSSDYDSDADGWSDLMEYQCGSDPEDPLDDCDGFGAQVPAWEISEVEVTYETQIQYGDVMFILDETGSMQPSLDDLADRFIEVVEEADALIPDLTFGVASFDDYVYEDMAAAPDLPYHFRQQQTTDIAAVQSALDGLAAGGGLDWTESSVEALYQATVGYGYDMSCDGQYDPAEDVLPFIGGPADPFGGAAGGNYDPSVPGTGSLGGNGFREGAVPILVYTTDALVRNAFPPYDQGPKGNTPPEGCAMDAAAPMLELEMANINAKAIGVAARTTDPLPAMEMIAQWTDSWVDIDGDGEMGSDEWMVYSSGSGAIVDEVVTALQEFTTFATYDLEMVTEDPEGAITAVDPPLMINVPALNTVTFTVTLEPTPDALASMYSDMVFVVPTTLYGDGGVVLAEWDLIFAVTSAPDTAIEP